MCGCTFAHMCLYLTTMATDSICGGKYISCKDAVNISQRKLWLTMKMQHIAIKNNKGLALPYAKFPKLIASSVQMACADFASALRPVVATSD